MVFSFKSKISLIIIIFVTSSVFLVWLVNYIFVKYEVDEPKNHLTIIIEIMVGLIVTLVVYLYSERQQKQIKEKEEKRRRSFYETIWPKALIMSLPVKHLLDMWQNIEKIDQPKRVKFIQECIVFSNRIYFEIRDLINYNNEIIHEAKQGKLIYSIDPIYENTWQKFQKNPEDKENIKKFNSYYNLILSIVPEKYQDEEIKKKIMDLILETESQ